MEHTHELHVVFGSGVLGKNAARELVRAGKRVRVINRSGRAPDLPEQVEVVKADAYDVAQARALTQGATSIYQCAQPAYHEWEEKFPPLQASILSAAINNGAKLVVADNLYMYGDTDGRPMTETSPYRAQTRKGRVRAAMATAIQDAHTQGKVRATIVRASDFFGPEDGALSPVVFGAAVSGKPANLMGRVDQPHTFSYAPDFGRTLALLGTRDEALGEIWHVPSNAPMTQAAFISMVAEIVGAPLKTRVAGSMMLNLLGLFNPLLREMPEMLYEWQKPFVMDDRKIRKAFGVAPTPMRQAVHETVLWFRSQR
jgi:nucleoside-diphosphate-sugar epimerase